MKPVAEFVLPCDPDVKHFYVVRFYATQAEMIAAMAALRGAPQDEDWDARSMCLRYVREISHEPTGPLKKTGELGTLFFVKGDAGPEVVVHELTHAAIGWAKRKKVNPLKHSGIYRKCPEEKFAYTFQFMFEQFYQKAPAALAVAA